MFLATFFSPFRLRQEMSGGSLQIISSRIFLDGSGLGVEPRRGHLLLPSLGMGDEFGRSEDSRKKSKHEGSQHEVLDSGNCSRAP